MSKKEYIERGALSKFVRDVRRKLPKDSKDFFTRDEMLLNFQQYVDWQPAADVEPVVRARWQDGKCTNCDCFGFPRYDGGNEYTIRCPNCGAHMVERSGSGE